MIQNIKIGDVVMGDDFKKGKTVRMLVRGRTTMYKVHQQNGIDYRVNKHHILSPLLDRARIIILPKIFKIL